MKPRTATASFIIELIKGIPSDTLYSGARPALPNRRLANKDDKAKIDAVRDTYVNDFILMVRVGDYAEVGDASHSTGITKTNVDVANDYNVGKAIASALENINKTALYKHAFKWKMKTRKGTLTPKEKARIDEVLQSYRDAITVLLSGAELPNPPIAPPSKVRTIPGTCKVRPAGYHKTTSTTAPAAPQSEPDVKLAPDAEPTPVETTTTTAAASTSEAPASPTPADDTTTATTGADTVTGTAGDDDLGAQQEAPADAINDDPRTADEAERELPLEDRIAQKVLHIVFDALNQKDALQDQLDRMFGQGRHARVDEPGIDLSSLTSGGDMPGINVNISITGNTVLIGNGKPE